jgi:hypothetical protein
VGARRSTNGASSHRQSLENSMSAPRTHSAILLLADNQTGAIFFRMNQRLWAAVIQIVAQA